MHGAMHHGRPQSFPHRCLNATLRVSIALSIGSFPGTGLPIAQPSARMDSRSHCRHRPGHPDLKTQPVGEMGCIPLSSREPQANQSQFQPRFIVRVTGPSQAIDQGPSSLSPTPAPFPSHRLPLSSTKLSPASGPLHLLFHLTKTPALFLILSWLAPSYYSNLSPKVTASERWSLITTVHQQ